VAVAATLVWHELRPDGSSVQGLRVSGGRLVSSDGQDAQLVGVNRSGTEFTCLGGHEVFQGPVGDPAIAAMKAWGVEIVRVPLNEDCWLGINGIRPAVGGSAYANAITGYVHRLEAHGMDVILDLHWSAPGNRLATSQQVMADSDHSPLFWHEVATRFRSDDHVMFDLYNEPNGVSWTCWRDGCTIPATGGNPPWRAAGMQQLVDTVRATGARNIVLVGGLDHAGDLHDWAEMVPHDPTGQIAASWHIYQSAGCSTSSCWQSATAGAHGHPVVVTEFGETDCGSTFVDPFMSWLDGRGISYLAWTWNDWPGCGGPSLLTSYDGTPRAAYGRAVRAHLEQRG
jgi:endoglucanase